MTTLIPIEHEGRRRRGIVVRRGRAIGEASPLDGRSSESVDDVVHAVALGETPPPSLELALWSLDAERGTQAIVSQVLLEHPETAVAEAERAIARGRRAFKLKLRSADDAPVLAELRALGGDLVLRVDANRAFATASEVPWDALARAGVEWIEEPCPRADDLADAPVAIALDESVAEDPERCLDAVRRGRVVALVLKPTVLGARRTLELAGRCRSLGGRAIVSHAFESVIALGTHEELARRIDPREIHGLDRWSDIDAYRITAGRAPVSSLISSTLVDATHADPALV